MQDKKTGLSACYGFVTFSDHKNSKNALEGINGRMLYDSHTISGPAMLASIRSVFVFHSDNFPVRCQVWTGGQGQLGIPWE